MATRRQFLARLGTLAACLGAERLFRPKAADAKPGALPPVGAEMTIEEVFDHFLTTET